MSFWFRKIQNLIERSFNFNTFRFSRLPILFVMGHLCRAFPPAYPCELDHSRHFISGWLQFLTFGRSTKFKNDHWFCKDKSNCNLFQKNTKQIAKANPLKFIASLKVAISFCHRPLISCIPASLPSHTNSTSPRRWCQDDSSYSHWGVRQKLFCTADNYFQNFEICFKTIYIQNNPQSKSI